MKLSRKFLLLSIVVLFLAAVSSLFIVKSEKDALQKNIDLIFTSAISDSMQGLSIDFSRANTNDKIEHYYQTIFNLKDALNVFSASSYKEQNDLFQALNHLYIYLLENNNGNYEIDDQLYILEFLGKALVNPNDSQLISDFNNYLDSKNQEK